MAQTVTISGQSTVAACTLESFNSTFIRLIEFPDWDAKDDWESRVNRRHFQMCSMRQHYFTGTVVHDAGDQMPFMRLPRTAEDETPHSQAG